MTALSAKAIRHKIFNETGNAQLYITPILELEDQLRSPTGSFDVRLGTTFITTRRTSFSHIDPFGGQAEKIRAEFESYQEERYVPFAEEFILHPDQFAIGCTLEYFRFPLDLMAYVIGRSSWGRLGLVIAMATVVHPGYTGVLSLELQNLGDVPITLTVGARIGQLVFHKVEGNEQLTFRDVYNTKYVAATRPSYSLIYEDSERELFKKYRPLAKQASQQLGGEENDLNDQENSQLIKG